MAKGIVILNISNKYIPIGILKGGNIWHILTITTNSATIMKLGMVHHYFFYMEIQPLPRCLMI
ncbi:hypothetical protein HMPREF9945_00118 [Clostridioides difficile 70-100-2010]|nr:hypothetical protein HMPREF9945_00118 [Clostridioides difficile 70-100-2010]